MTKSTPVQLYLLLVLLSLASCQSAPRLEEMTAWQVRESELLDLSDWRLQGRVNARYQEESHTPRIRWQQNQENYAIRLWGTFNAGATNIQGRPGFVTFEQGSEVRTASRPEDLILEHLGYELPVSQLEYWIKGVPTPEVQHEMQLGEFNEVLSLEQSGWQISYRDYRLYGDYSLPRRIEMSRDENNISLTFFGLNWSIGEAL